MTTQSFSVADWTDSQSPPQTKEAVRCWRTQCILAETKTLSAGSLLVFLLKTCLVGSPGNEANQTLKVSAVFECVTDGIVHHSIMKSTVLFLYRMFQGTVQWSEGSSQGHCQLPTTSYCKRDTEMTLTGQGFMGCITTRYNLTILPFCGLWTGFLAGKQSVCLQPLRIKCDTFLARVKARLPDHPDYQDHKKLRKKWNGQLQIFFVHAHSGYYTALVLAKIYFQDTSSSQPHSYRSGQ